MSEREPSRSRALEAYFRPRLPDRVERLLFESGAPGRKSVGARLADRLDELLVVAGLRLLVMALFVDLVTGEFLALTVFNVALGVPVLALTVYQFLGSRHEMDDPSLRERLTGWRRDRRWYSKRSSDGDRRL